MYILRRVAKFVGGQTHPQKRLNTICSQTILFLIKFYLKANTDLLFTGGSGMLESYFWPFSYNSGSSLLRGKKIIRFLFN